MNQILDYSPDKGSKKSSGSDKIVHFFAVIMIIFAIALIAGAGYNLYQNSKEEKKAVVEEEKAKIEVIQQDTQAIIKVTHTKAIEKIIYSWNNGKETPIKGTGESIVEEAIPLPAGENALHIKVIDIDGGESTFEGTYTSETGKDILNPVIKLKVTNEKKLKITATDETSLDFITYRWNDEEEVKVEPEDDKTKIEIEIDILKGVNDLMVTAVDSSNNTTMEEQSFTGLTKPEIMIVVAADKTSADVTVKHEQGLKEVKLNLNDAEYPIEVKEENKTEITFKVNLVEGNNKMTVTATSVDDTQTIATEEVDNTPEEQPTEEQPTEEEPTEEQPTEDVQITIEEIEDGQLINFKASHSSGIKEIEVSLNGNYLDLSALGELGEDKKEIEFNLERVFLADGNNQITFKVIPVEGTEKQEIKEIVK